MTQDNRAGPPEACRTDQLLAHALGCPHDRGGLALAVRHACRCLAAAAAVMPTRPALQAWRDAAVAMAARLKAQSASQPALLTSSAEMLTLPGYGAWLSQPPANAMDPRVQQLWAVQGHALAAFACSGSVVPPALLHGLTQAIKHQRGSGRQHGWAQIALDFPSTAADVQRWMGKTSTPAVRRMLAALELMWKMPLVPPDSLLEPVAAKVPAAHSELQAGSLQPNEPVDIDDDLEDDDDDDDDGVRPASLLGWLTQRANYAGMRSRFGADGHWDALTPAELTHVCKAIRAELLAQTEAARFALLAVVCLCSSLPARLAMTLAMQPNGDIWIPADFGSVRWSLQRLLDGRTDATATIEPTQPDRVVDIALPAAAAHFGRHLVDNQPGASNLEALLASSDDPAAHREFLEAYRGWLRGLGPGWIHAIYDVRLAMSLSQIHRALHGDVAAAWLSLDFREAALGMMHYASLPRETLHQWASQAYSAIGLGEAAGVAARGFVGSAVALDAQAFAAGWKALQAACERHRVLLATCTDLGAAARAATDLNTARLAAVVIAMAGRGTLLPRLSWPALYTHPDLVLLLDKRVDAYSDLRGIPVHELLREQLDAHLEDLRQFGASCRRLGHASTDHRGRDMSRMQDQGAAFFGLQVHEAHGAAALRRAAISTGDIDAVSQQHFGQPINVGRHTLLTLAVVQGWDPWWPKALSGHHRGHAEPFADGGVVAPAHLLVQLSHALDRALGHLVSEPHSNSRERVVLDVNRLRAPNASSPLAQVRAPGSKARLLPPAWQPSTLVALRVCDHLRRRLAHGEGPSHAGAEVLLVGLLVNSIYLDDLRLIWIDHQAFQLIGERGAVVLWRRAPGAQEQQRQVTPLWATALQRARGSKGQLPAWAGCVEHAAGWLRVALPEFGWHEEDHRCLRALEQLFQAWQRFCTPPFLLSAAAPALGAAVANRASLQRLASSRPLGGGEDDVLLLQAPLPRAAARAPLRESPLNQVLKLVHRYGRTDLQLGEDGQRWQDLAKAVAELDCSADARARVVVDVVRLDHDRWRTAHAHRIQVSSLSTYLYRIAADLDRIAPTEDLAIWQEEWADWHDAVEKASVAGDADKRAALEEERLVAARHLLRGLSELKYPVPAELLAPDSRPGATTARWPASATVLLRADQERIRGLLKRHFADVPVLGDLADLYCSLVFGASLRGAEVGALTVDAVTPFGDLAVDTGGFSHLKSEHARRLQRLTHDVSASFRAAADLVQAAEPGARWIFLLNNPNDWGTASTVAKAFGAALRQVTGDGNGRQHATRPLAPLAQLLPQWEDTLGAVARGQASTQQCVDFMASIQQQGVGRLVQVLHAAGHGHPLTFLAHYFAIWPWVMAAHAQAMHAGFGDATALVRARMPQAYAAFRKARERAKTARMAFDSWGWVGRAAVARMDLPPLQVDRTAQAGAKLSPPTGPAIQSSGPALVQYLAARFMGLAPAAAAHAFGLRTAEAASAEADFDEQAASALRQRHQGDAQGRGRDAELKLLRGEDGATLAARMLALPVGDIRRFAQALSTQRMGPQPLLSIDELLAHLQACCATLPQRYGLYVQTGQNKYGAEDLARIPASSKQLVLGPADRDLRNRPRVSVVDAGAPHNRVRRARLTSLVRCLAQAAISLRPN